LRRNDQTEFEVIILGTGIAGTILGAILAKHGRKVLMLDGAVHPRFAVGESTIPHTSQLLSLLSREHDIPELHYIGLGSPEHLRDRVTRNCGVKRVFGFVYHRPGQEHDPNEALQFGNVWRDENHYFRQDIDAYLLVTALHYGAHAVQGVKIESVDIQPERVIVGAGGNKYTAKYVVDGTGFRSVIADRFKLREEPCPLFTTTRSIFTHMVDVHPFEDVITSKMEQRWSQSTLHHCFKRGWTWVIPFNNWEGAPNKLVSVGVTVDERHHPEDPKASPEQEFEHFVEMFPSVARQFKDAKLARPWVRTKRLQYSATKVIGDRWALLSHAGGFIDPLFSRGMVNTMDNLRSLSRTLLAALDDGDFSEARFARIDHEQKRNVNFHDLIVAGSYISWDDFDLWNAWVRLWAMGVHDTESRLGSVLLMGDYSRVKPVTDPIASDYEGPGYRALFTDMWTTIHDYDQQKLTLAQAKERLWKAVTGYEFSLPLRDEHKGQEWALRYPRVRDLFLGRPERHARWMKQLPDEHLL
jgi:FADH2 O2-dependent halogenase